jgi:hypothetical protein
VIVDKTLISGLQRAYSYSKQLLKEFSKFKEFLFLFFRIRKRLARTGKANRGIQTIVFVLLFLFLFKFDVESLLPKVVATLFIWLRKQCELENLTRVWCALKVSIY